MAENENKVEKVEKKAEKKTEKKSDKKPGFFDRVKRWFREMRSELKKVQWPTRKQTVNNTLIVIACVIVVGICIWVFDALAGAVVRALIHLSQSL